MRRRDLLRGGLAAGLGAALGSCSPRVRAAAGRVRGRIVDDDFKVGHLLRDGGHPES